jgi:hypothetical protein
MTSRFKAKVIFYLYVLWQDFKTVIRMYITKRRTESESQWDRRTQVVNRIVFRRNLRTVTAGRMMWLLLPFETMAVNYCVCIRMSTAMKLLLFFTCSQLRSPWTIIRCSECTDRSQKAAIIMLWTAVPASSFTHNSRWLYVCSCNYNARANNTSQLLVKLQTDNSKRRYIHHSKPFTTIIILTTDTFNLLFKRKNIYMRLT